jgi:hypothetical protein
VCKSRSPLRLIAVKPQLTLFADQNKDAGGQRHKVEQENRRPELQAEAQQAVDDQVNRKQKHADVFGDFHDVDLFGGLFG